MVHNEFISLHQLSIGGCSHCIALLFVESQNKENFDGFLSNKFFFLHIACIWKLFHIPNFHWRFHHWQQRKQEHGKWSVVPRPSELPSDQDPWRDQPPQQSRMRLQPSCTFARCHGTGLGRLQSVGDCPPARVQLSWAFWMFS